jgi:hypothetical protein
VEPIRISIDTGGCYYVFCNVFHLEVGLGLVIYRIYRILLVVQRGFLLLSILILLVSPPNAHLSYSDLCYIFLSSLPSFWFH